MAVTFEDSIALVDDDLFTNPFLSRWVFLTFLGECLFGGLGRAFFGSGVVDAERGLLTPLSFLRLTADNFTDLFPFTFSGKPTPGIEGCTIGLSGTGVFFTGLGGAAGFWEELSFEGAAGLLGSRREVCFCLLLGETFRFFLGACGFFPIDGLAGVIDAFFGKEVGFSTLGLGFEGASF